MNASLTYDHQLQNIIDDWKCVIYLQYVKSRRGPGSRPVGYHAQSKNATNCLLTRSMLVKIALNISYYSRHPQKFCFSDHNCLSLNGSVFVQSFWS